MAEYTAQMAARQTRCAVVRVRKALDDLLKCATHFEDMDDYMRWAVIEAANIPPPLEELEVYPVKRRLRKRA